MVARFLLLRLGLAVALAGLLLVGCSNPLSERTSASDGDGLDTTPANDTPALLGDQPEAYVPSGYAAPAVVPSSNTPPETFDGVFRPVGTVWSVSVDGQDSVDFGAELAILRFPYEPADIADGGFLEEFVVVVSNRGTDWERVERTYVETDGEAWFVVAETSHFSDFVVTAATPPSVSSVTPAPGMDELFPDGIAGTGGAVFSLIDESFTYYQDRDYYIVPASESPTNAATFAALGLDGSVGISTFNGGSTGGPVSDHKHNTGLDYIRFTAHQDLDVHVMYDTRGGTGADDTSMDAEWVRPGNGFDDTGHKLETTDPVGLYTVYKKSFTEGQIVRLDGNWNGTGVDTSRIQTNYWVIIKPKGSAESDSGTIISDTTEVTGITLDTVPGSIEPLGSLSVTASIEPADAPNSEMSWSSSNEEVATISAITSDRKRVWVVGRKPGTSEIWAESRSGVESERITVTVEFPNSGDGDSDGDTIVDRDEAEGDTDTDGTPDENDPDDDGDGVPTAREVQDAAAEDTDQDGWPDHLDADDDGDGIPTIQEFEDVFQQTPRRAGNGDTDSDGIPNWRDTDSDGDGVPDSDEGRSDWDADGISDYLDADDDGDGIRTIDELDDSPDWDSDGVPQYLDIDSDGDGISEEIESRDSNRDGLIDISRFGVDRNQNGLDDAYDPEEGGVGTMYLDSDGDGTPNLRDQDDDDDQMSTRDEVNALSTSPAALDPLSDVDGDGLPAWMDYDSDGDLIADGDEGPWDQDSDGDGTPDFLDPE